MNVLETEWWTMAIPPEWWADTQEDSILVGDRWRDIEAGQRAGVGITILIDYCYAEQMTV